MKGRTIKIYLVDGTPNSILTAEILNWTGKVTLVPRTQLQELAKRDEIKRTGVYVLVGEIPDNPNQTMVYVGESDNVWKRLTQHIQDPDNEFWRRTIIICSKDDNLTKAHVRYLESRLIQIAIEAQRAKLYNVTKPETPSLPEPDIADMEFFLQQIQMLLPVLGFSFITPLPKTEKIVDNDENKQETSDLFILSYAGAKAIAREINDEFVVLKGSTARIKHVKSLSPHYIQTRTQLCNENKLILNDDEPDYWIFTQNTPFLSPSTAAAIVSGTQINGRTAWKEQSSNKSYDDWQKDKIQQSMQK